jgi:hypothetical protein
MDPNNNLQMRSYLRFFCVITIGSRLKTIGELELAQEVIQNETPEDDPENDHDRLDG